MKNKFFTIILAAVASLFAATTASAQDCSNATYESICLSGSFNNWGDQPMTPVYTDGTENHLWYTTVTFDEDHREFKFKDAESWEHSWGNESQNSFYDRGTAVVNGYNFQAGIGKYLLIFDDASCNYRFMYLSESAKSVNIKVENPGELESLVQEKITNTEDVYELIISGTLNEQDMAMMDKLYQLTNLVFLDLSGTNITTAPNCDLLQYLTVVKLPQTVTSVGNYAFSSCSALLSINLPNATSISSYAFRNCSSLTSISLPKATSISERAFYDCSSLTSISLPNVTSIGEWAFCNCSSLTSIELPKATSIGDYAFYFCSSLTSIEIPNVTSIGEGAFGSCDSLTSISLSGKLSTLGRYAFSGCSNLKEVYCHRLYPITTDAFNNIPSGATLYAPAATLDLYKAYSSWNMFYNYVAITEPISTLTFDNANTLTSTEGFEDKISLTLNETAHLTVAADSTLNVSDFQMNVNYSKYDYSYNTNYQRIYYIPTLINTSPIIADNVSVKMTFYTGQWYFLSLPFDCKVGDIEKEDGVYWVVRKYSGANRASGEGKTWITLTDNDTIKAGEGFILQCSEDWYGSKYPTFTFHAIDNAKKNDIFTLENVSLPLTEYASANAANRNWNLVGNPYPAYFNVSDIEEEAIVTVWNGYNYDVYSTLDDGYNLSPFEAYFVQRPTNVQTLTHSLSGRSTDKHNYTLSFEFSSRKLDSYYLEYMNNQINTNAPKFMTDDTANAYWNSLLQEVNTSAQKYVDDLAEQANDETLTLALKMFRNGVLIKQYVWTNSYSSLAKERKAQMKANRKVYNFMLTGEEMSDRARIVVNPEAQEGYEVGRDAAKFASLDADAPQLFVNRNGSSLAIDESPLESGKAKLGISSVKTNQYTISLSAINSSESVMLTDNVTGTTTDLTTSDYTFTAQPGTNASRFTVSFGTVDGISNVNDNDNDNTGVYDLTGRRMAKTVKGLNIVNHRKIIVK